MTTPQDSGSGRVEVTPRQAGEEFSLTTGQLHLFVLRRMRSKVLEVEDAHFHHDSAVLLPDYGDCAATADPADANHVSGLAVLRACYLHAQRAPSNRLLVVGHTDRSGPDDYNLKLSQLRADNVRHALLGERDRWVEICDGKHKTEDIQQILIWVNATFGWPCSPGPKTGSMNAQTRSGVRKFQESYNAEFDPDIAVDGDVGPQTWGAFFDVYAKRLKQICGTDDAGLAALRDPLRGRFLDPVRPTVGCGESHPISSDLRSATDRRVEILFFDPPDTPSLDCHPAPLRCDKTRCELYGPNRIFDHEPLPCDPTDVGRRFRLRVELGDVDALFPAIASPTHTDAGVRQRLQAIGFLYEPLNGADIAAIAQPAWDHFKRIAGSADDAAAAEELRARVRSTVVEGGALPAPGAFSRLRVPGAYCVRNADMAANYFGSPPGGPAQLGANSFHFRLEQAVWTANPSLGLVPIVAVVEERAGNTWGPAPEGLRVHFQLVAPDAPPAGSPAAPPALRAAPLVSTNPQPPAGGAPTPPIVFNMTGAPATYLQNERARNPAAADPLVDNAHRSVGGKRGNAIAGGNRLVNLLETGSSHPGLHGALGIQPAAASTHPNAVVAVSGAGGRAAVVLLPAFTGGDRYKLRAFLDPIPEAGADQPSDGTGPSAVAAETGTLVVWRILRISKYLRWDYPPAAVNPSDALHRANCSGALQDFDVAGVIAAEYRKAWLDVEVETQARTPQPIDQGSWRAAIQFAKRRVIAAPPGLTQAYNLNVLIAETTATPGVHNNNAGLIRLLSAAQYDAAPKGPAPGGLAAWPPAIGHASYLRDAQALMFRMADEFMQFYTDNAISGVSIVQCPVMTSLEADMGFPITNDPQSGGLWLRSGWGGMRRGCYVTFGQGTYTNPGFPYDHNHNALHETGHTLYGVHQYTATNQVSNGAAGNTGVGFDEHDYHDLCVMGYMNLRPGGEFCGRCVLQLAGWNTRAMPANSPGL